jgi:hypothetical protein
VLDQTTVERPAMAAEGIFEELAPAPGQLEIKAFDSHGVRMAMLQFRADTVDDELIVDLKRWHTRTNGVTHLMLVASSGAS